MIILAAAGCDQPELQAPEPVVSGVTEPDGPVTPRADECDECPVDDCCCSVILQGTGIGATSISLCGTTDGTGTCGPITHPTCPSATNGGQSISLSSANPKHLFCMGTATGLSIRNNSGATINLRLTCQSEDANGQTDNVTIPANSSAHIDVDGGCEVENCM